MEMPLSRTSCYIIRFRFWVMRVCTRWITWANLWIERFPAMITMWFTAIIKTMIIEERVMEWAMERIVMITPTIIPMAETTARWLWSWTMLYVATMIVETLRSQSKSSITWPPMEIMKVWFKSIIVTHIRGFHMITWESAVVYVVM